MWEYSTARRKQLQEVISLCSTWNSQGTNNAKAVYGQADALKEKIKEWIKKPSTYDDQAQSCFDQLIDGCAADAMNNIKSHVKTLKQERVRAIVTKRNCDMASLKLKPSLIAKSLGCGTIGSLASMQLATQITAAMTLASYSTPVGWIGGTGSAVVYYHFDKQVQTRNIKYKAVVDIEKTDGVAEKIVSSLNQRQLNLKLGKANADISQYVGSMTI